MVLVDALGWIDLSEGVLLHFLLEAHKVGELRVNFLVHCYKIIKVDHIFLDLRSWQKIFQNLGISLFISRQKVNFVVICETLEMFEVILKNFSNFRLELVVKTFGCLIIYKGIFKILIIVIEHLSIRLFESVSQSMESLHIFTI